MPQDMGTKQRILGIALELFTSKGYAETSLREIAERVGVSKAALYYHFPSKGDILLALHARMHSLINGPLATLGEPPVSAAKFERFLEEVMDVIQGNELLFRLHQENESVLMALHADNESHGESDIDLQGRLRLVLTDPSLSEEERVRWLGASMIALLLPLAAREMYPYDDCGEYLRALVSRVMEATP